MHASLGMPPRFRELLLRAPLKLSAHGARLAPSSVLSPSTPPSLRRLRWSSLPNNLRQAPVDTSLLLFAIMKFRTPLLVLLAVALAATTSPVMADGSADSEEYGSRANETAGSGNGGNSTGNGTSDDVGGKDGGAGVPEPAKSDAFSWKSTVAMSAITAVVVALV